MNWIIGIDTDGKGIYYQIQNESGAKLAEGRAVKRMEGWRAFRELCSSHGLVPERTSVVIEATGRHHLPWCERLHEEGFKVYSINPLMTKRLHSSDNAIRDNKDDRIDAHTLCEIGRIHAQALVRFSYRGQNNKIQLQTLVSSRTAIRIQRTNLLKSAGDLLDLVFPEAKPLGFKLTSTAFRGLLRKAPTPGKIAGISEEALHESLGAKAKELQKAAAASITPESIATACSQALVHMLEAIESLSAQIDALDHAIKEAAQKDPSLRKTEALIRSCPGFGKVSTPILAAFLPPDIKEWAPTKKKTVRKIQALFGFDPRRRESGTHKGKVKLSKRGIEAARTALYQASFCSINHDPQLRAYYQKKKAEGDHHKKVVIDLMRKNLRRIVSVLIDEKPFEFRSENV